MGAWYVHVIIQNMNGNLLFLTKTLIMMTIIVMIKWMKTFEMLLNRCKTLNEDFWNYTMNEVFMKTLWIIISRRKRQIMLRRLRIITSRRKRQMKKTQELLVLHCSENTWHIELLLLFDTLNYCCYPELCQSGIMSNYYLPYCSEDM